MASFKIKWTRRAESEFLEALEYHIVRNKSAHYSKKLIEKVEMAMERISTIRQ